MMRSLFSAVTGLKNHQTRMDVIGNNVANVNTTGYKRNMVNFTTILSQTLRGAASPTTDRGGTNPMQVGLGMSIGSIEKIMTEGSSQMTGVATHAKIAGPGWFMLSKAADQNIVYSRAGVFIVDAAGFLVDSATGYFVLNGNGDKIWVDPDIYSLPTVKLASNGEVMAVNLVTGEEEVIVDGDIALAIFPNEAGMTAIGNTYYRISPNSGEPDIYSATNSTFPYPEGTELVPGFIEMSNVNLADEFTDMIITQRGFQANSRVITVSDTLLEELINLKR